MNAAFDAMSTWRTETVNNSEKNLEQVIEKMAAAARALGWPEQIVDATRSQMQTVTKTQIQMMDQMVDAWEEQIKSPNPSAMLSKLKSLSGFDPAGTWANPADMSAMNPMQFTCNFSSSGRRYGRTRWRFGPRLPARSGLGLEHNKTTYLASGPYVQNDSSRPMQRRVRCVLCPSWTGVFGQIKSRIRVEAAGAEVFLSPGNASCKTPCSVAAPEKTGSYNAMFVLAGYIQQTIPVRVSTAKGHWYSSDVVEVTPNPVTAVLKAEPGAPTGGR